MLTADTYITFCTACIAAWKACTSIHTSGSPTGQLSRDRADIVLHNGGPGMLRGLITESNFGLASIIPLLRKRRSLIRTPVLT